MNLFSWRVPGVHFRLVDVLVTVGVLWAFFGWVMHSFGQTQAVLGKSFLLALLVTLPLAVFFHVFLGLIFNKGVPIATALNCWLKFARPEDCNKLTNL